ncbi:preprotein translocase subunit YajC [Streptomyces sp. YS-3]|uniref:preprotein translocase subunit YajC n=1 Tax=Streptomyces sp. YS-3 TaxID=3381352 RepID=UPI003862BEAA
MNPVTLLPFIILIGAMFLMTRSAKRKQQQAAAMRNDIQPGTGVRTIGGMYATVKEIGDDTIHLEVAPGVHAVYAKNAIGAVLSDEEYNRIVHGETDEASDLPAVPDDASSLTETAGHPADEAEAADVAEAAPADKIDLGKKDEADDAAAPKDGKADGGSDAK